ncbi:alpha-glucosidase/alpha-galactosidase [soil metagenome]
MRSPRHVRVAIIGAGSVVFTKTLVRDILAGPIRDVEFVLMAPSTRRTSLIKRWADRLIEVNSLPATTTVETDQAAAVAGSDYVITTFQVGGLRATELDYEIPERYGVDQCIGDTLGPGGVFRALRAIPIARQVVRDIVGGAPGATLLNYTNPMAMVVWAMRREASVPVVGLCHGVQVTLDLVAGYTGVPKDQIVFESAGINHMAWFLRLEHEGRDLYPVLRERFEDPSFYVNEKVRGEMFRQFGYFMTESTGHLSEYLPYFRKSPEALDLYCDRPAFGGESGALVRWTRLMASQYTDHDVLHEGGTGLPGRTDEYGPRIIEAIETDVPFHFQGNGINRSAITNLPADACVEGPMYADGAGLHPVMVGDLPSQCAALNQTNINVQRLAVEAALAGDPEALVHACALDPLTGAVMTLREIREMASEMLEAQREWLPQFAGRTIRPTPAISIPADVVPAEVPLDPALSIAARYGDVLSPKEAGQTRPTD